MWGQNSASTLKLNWVAESTPKKKFIFFFSFLLLKKIMKREGSYWFPNKKERKENSWSRLRIKDPLSNSKFSNPKSQIFNSKFSFLCLKFHILNFKFNLKISCSKFQVANSQISSFKNFKLQNFKISSFKISSCKFSNLKFQKFQVANFQNLKFQNFKMQSFKISSFKLQNLKFQVSSCKEKNIFQGTTKIHQGFLANDFFFFSNQEGTKENHNGATKPSSFEV